MRRLLVLATLAACLVPSLAGAASPSSPTRPPMPQGNPPSGFSDSLVAGGLNQPVALTGLPDGRTIVLQKGGAMRVIKNGALLPAAAINISVCTQSERGLLGVAADPNFGANGYLYVYYTRPAAGAPGGCVNRVSRYTMAGDTISSASQVVLLDNIGSPAGNHNGGDLAIGNDGFLYVAVGDGGSDPRGDSGSAGGNNAAQDPSLLNGKILRVNRSTGFAAPGNPISGAGTADCRVRGNTPTTPTTSCRELFAWGLRNPWRFAFDPNTGATRFYINDVGQGTREEVNLGTIGANYGWPAREGVCAQGQNPPSCAPPAGGLGYTQPITDYSPDENRTDFGGNYVTGGAFVPNGAWPQSYDGGYLYADGGSGRMFHRPAVAPPVPNSVYTSPFATALDGVSDIEFVMETGGWALYYVSPSNGQLRRIVYNTTPAPLPPDSSAFVPLTPWDRAFDSRFLGGDTGPLRAGTSRLINLAGSAGAHRSALVNITMVKPGATAFANVWQPRSSRPVASNINADPGRITANSSIVPIDANGNILLYVTATSHVVVDVMGFFDDTASNTSTFGRFEALDPVRAADTREPANETTNQYTSSMDGAVEVINVPIEGEWGVPANVSAVAVIVTALSGSIPISGFVTVMPNGALVPTASNVNVNGNGDIRANLAVVPVGANGTIDLRLTSTARVLVDVVGSFTDSSAPLSTGGMYTAVSPTRVVDTRTPLGFSRLSANGTGSINPTVVPNDAQALAQNVVVTKTGGHGFITTYPTGISLPTVSNGNVTGAGQTRSVMALTSVGTGGSVSYFVSMAADVVVDVTGYFNPAPG